MKKYPNCKVALQWWCNAYYTAENGVQQMSRFSINRNKWLKEFITQNPPDFPISNKCCEYAKKKPARQFVKETGADLEITGIRKSEGGIRSANYKTCFSESKSKGCVTYRPIFWYTDSDKRDYEDFLRSNAFSLLCGIWLKTYRLCRLSVQPSYQRRTFNHRKYEPKLYTDSCQYFREILMNIPENIGSL